MWIAAAAAARNAHVLRRTTNTTGAFSPERESEREKETLAHRQVEICTAQREEERARRRPL